MKKEYLKGLEMVDNPPTDLVIENMNQFGNGYPYHLPFPDGSIDRVHFSHVLHRDRHTADIIREAFRVIKPGGLVLVRTPNEGWCWADPYAVKEISQALLESFDRTNPFPEVVKFNHVSCTTSGRELLAEMLK